MLFIRSFLFDSFFYIFTTVYVITLFPIILLNQYSLALRIYRIWSSIIIWVLEKSVGIKIIVQGKENIPNKPHIIAFQHQSALDTIIPPLLFNNFALALKKELLFIPFLGLYLYKLKAIFLDRKQGVSSLKKLLKEAKEAYKCKKNILIYPQGTRTKVNEYAKIQSGILALYTHLQSPILPVSINTGLFWPRKGFIKKPGIVNVRIHPVIKSDLPKESVKQQIEALYNENTPL